MDFRRSSAVSAIAGCALLTQVSLGCGAKSALELDGVRGVGGNQPFAGTGINASGGSTSQGGAVSSGGGAGAGCTGSYEHIQGGLCVAEMATILGQSGLVAYQIDVTEVTQGQYDDWLATHPTLPAYSDVNCGYVTNYAEQGISDVYSGPNADHHPVVYVDWCDARAYCAAVGKRLCGAIGGGTSAFDGYANANQSEWYRACSSGGVNAYPYGNSYEPSTCDSYDYWNGTNLQTVSVGSLPGCVTATPGYAGVYDLSGNVWEWEDSCNGTGPNANCRVRGGAFYSYGDYLTCGCDNFNYIPSVGSNFGFRCCSG